MFPNSWGKKSEKNTPRLSWPHCNFQTFISITFKLNTITKYIDIEQKGEIEDICTARSFRCAWKAPKNKKTGQCDTFVLARRQKFKFQNVQKMLNFGSCWKVSKCFTQTSPKFKKKISRCGNEGGRLRMGGVGDISFFNTFHPVWNKF